jgi:hypothetical protein
MTVTLIAMAAVSLSAAAPAPAEMPVPLVVEGKCDPKSGVEVGADGLSRFECDVAVIAQTPRGILIQFTDKSGRDGRILGFAGTIEGKQGFGADPTQVVAVERLYLKGGGEPLRARRGTCFLNWSDRKLASVLCGAAAEHEGTPIKAMAALKVE